MSIPIQPPPAPSEPTANAPTLGATITLSNGFTARVHCDCKATRDSFVKWHRLQVLGLIADMLKSKEIGPDEAATRRAEAFEAFGAGRYDFGSRNNFDKRFTDVGIKQQLAIRVALAHEQSKDAPHPDLIAEWVDANGADQALEVMALADGNAPK